MQAYSLPSLSPLSQVIDKFDKFQSVSLAQAKPGPLTPPCGWSTALPRARNHRALQLVRLSLAELHVTTVSRKQGTPCKQAHCRVAARRKGPVAPWPQRIDLWFPNTTVPATTTRTVSNRPPTNHYYQSPLGCTSHHIPLLDPCPSAVWFARPRI